ncbi:MAG TPA: STAS domain-containing protein [Solirubrobacteraceae bacterium]|nr:STAS domain-containing protein [Solirubrobacteraceae bacterium]
MFLSSDCHTLRLSGELDLACRVGLEGVVARLCSGASTVVLDLRAVYFIDASAIHVALHARDLCSARGCELRIIPGPPPVQPVFELGGVLEHLPFQADDQLRPELSGGDSENGAAPGLLAARATRPRRERFHLSSPP